MPALPHQILVLSVKDGLMNYRVEIFETRIPMICMIL